MKTTTLTCAARSTPSPSLLHAGLFASVLAWLRAHPTGCEIAALRMKRF